MRDQIDKFISIEKEIAKERGSFSLFALFLREDAQNKWDVIVSAPWFTSDKKGILNYIGEKIRTYLKPQELLLLSRIILIEPTDDSIKAIHSAFRIEHGRVELANCNLFGLQIKQAYIITSNKDASINTFTT